MAIVPNVLSAQSYDRKAYTKWQLDKGYDNGIPIGTKITKANWQQYQQFMSEGLKTLFAGTHYWHVPDNVEIDVGPTRHYHTPTMYLANSEKYSGQVKLEATPDGGYTLNNYTAGRPFLDPLAGDSERAGQRIYYNNFYRATDRVDESWNCSYIQDQYGNATKTGDVPAVASQLRFLSDPGFPPDDPNSGGYWTALWAQQAAPEQGKYFTILTIVPAESGSLEEQYEFIPSLRRSLRVSQAARCSPVFGTDDTIEDLNISIPRQGQFFNIKYLGQKKLLALTHAMPESLSPAVCKPPHSPPVDFFYPISKDVGPFPTPRTGTWEVRDAYVLEFDRLPKLTRGYCYGKRICYVDKESYWVLYSDVWDTSDRLYKAFILPNAPASIADGEIYPLSGDSFNIVYNFQDDHATNFIGTQTCSDKSNGCEPYLDATVYASPAGLMKVMK